MQAPGVAPALPLDPKRKAILRHARKTFVRSVFRLVMAERPRFQAVAIQFFEDGRKAFGATLISILIAHSRAGALKPIDHPSWAAGNLMGMIEHPVFFVPLVTGDEVKVRRTIAEIVEDAVATFLARYGA